MTKEMFQILIIGSRWFVSRQPANQVGWMLLGEATNASGAESIIDRWKNGG